MSNIDHEKIESYLSGDMQETDRAVFEAALAADPELAAELRLYRQIQDELSIQAQQQQQEAALKQTLAAAEKKYFTSEKSTAKVVAMGNKKLWYSLIAAAAAIALFFILRPMFSNAVMSNESLYQQYAQLDPLDIGKRGATEDSVLVNMKKLYNNKQYPAALQLADRAIAIAPNDISLKLARAHCYTETGNYNAAIPLLDSIAAGSSVYKYPALFFKALTYLREDKKADCIQVLGSIPPDAEKYKQARELLDKLK